MTIPTIRIHDQATDKIIDREMNKEEFAQYEIEKQAREKREQAETIKAAEKAALLEKLGITADEAALLLS